MTVSIAVVNQTIGNNETWLYAFQFGVVGDLSWSFDHKDLYCDVKVDPADASPLLALSTVASTLVISDPDARIMNFHVEDEILRNALLPGNYSYDLIMVDQTTDDTQRLMTGKLTVVEGVTKKP